MPPPWPPPSHIRCHSLIDHVPKNTCIIFEAVGVWSMCCVCVAFNRQNSSAAHGGHLDPHLTELADARMTATFRVLEYRRAPLAAGGVGSRTNSLGSCAFPIDELVLPRVHMRPHPRWGWLTRRFTHTEKGVGDPFHMLGASAPDGSVLCTEGHLCLCGFALHVCAATDVWLITWVTPPPLHMAPAVSSTCASS